MKPYKIMFICGESSGDLLASELMMGLNRTGQNFEFSGIFGASCEEYLNRKSLVPLLDIAVMGLTEIIPALFKIRNAMTNAVQYIADNDIDMLICVDAFAFTHPVAVTARTYYPHLKIVKYVAPKLWAWGNYRAKKLQNIYDLILCNLPFEVNFFAGYGIKSEYVGHSVTKRIPIVSKNELQTFAKNQNFNPNKQNILLLAGSRKSEIIRLMPVWLEFTKHYDENFIVPVADNMMDFMQKNFGDIFYQKNIFIIPPSQRFHAFLSADFALAASGTVSLELMMCDVPAIIGYKMSAVTAWIAKKLIQVKYVSLLNIMLDKYILPEYLQENCHFNAIQSDFEALLGKKSLYDVQKNAYIQGIKTISVYDKNGDIMDTADTASKYILNIK